ncbi:hypothetical protein [Blastochloris viridis]|uniref:Uncharacterized protein n=1 Tax=Blastochloris viridis TaxID=1079 RepID=A0A0H5BID3_BLAVI|nr:hypothetical protein [Blastochloris viridis]ALK09228.1 hypothetical protein BVIR_1445 [Blastochloris viridis]BAS00905.1 hypothetical protein BV133_3311 [Blastochloris viridis]CUU41891.1 hypothetical protein BVIRIDIS_08900 [Blastochloris viridis]
MEKAADGVTETKAPLLERNTSPERKDPLLMSARERNKDEPWVIVAVLILCAIAIIGTLVIVFGAQPAPV